METRRRVGAGCGGPGRRPAMAQPATHRRRSKTDCHADAGAARVVCRPRRRLLVSENPRLRRAPPERKPRRRPPRQLGACERRRSPPRGVARESAPGAASGHGSSYAGALAVLGGHFSHIAKRLEASTLTPSARLVLFIICSATDKRSGGSVISATKIASRAGLSVGHVRRLITELVDFEWLTVSKVGHNRNKYVVATDLPDISVRAGAHTDHAPARTRQRASARTTYLIPPNTFPKAPTDLSGRPVEDLSDGKPIEKHLLGRSLVDLVREQRGLSDAG